MGAGLDLLMLVALSLESHLRNAVEVESRSQPAREWKGDGGRTLGVGTQTKASSCFIRGLSGCQA